MKKFFFLIIVIIACTRITNAQSSYPLVSIYDLQYVNDQNLINNNDSSSYFGDTVQVEGIVTFNPCAYALSTTGSRVGTWLQQDGLTGPWTGVAILIDPTAIGFSGNVTDLDAIVKYKDNFVVGNKVKATVIVSDFANNTQLLCLPIESEVTGFGSLPSPTILPIDTFMKLNTSTSTQDLQLLSGEKYEGTYIEFQNVQITDITFGNGRIFWTLKDPAGNKIKIRDVSGYFRNDTSDNFCTSVGSYTPAVFDTPLVNSTVAYVRGILLENKPGGNPYEYNIAPLDSSDLGPQTAAFPVITNVAEAIAVPTTSETQTISAKITDADGTITSAILFYREGLIGSNFFSITMTAGANNIYSGTIPAITTDSTWVKYYIRAVDDNGNISVYTDTLGTNQYYLVINSGVNSITDVQSNPVNGFDSPLANSKLTSCNIEGIVMSSAGLYDLGLVCIQEGIAEWQGIMLNGPGINSLQRGDKIKITAAKVIEQSSVTKLDSITYTVISSSNPLYPSINNLNLDSVRLGSYNYAEKFESMLLNYDNVYVVNTNPDAPSTFGEWSFGTSTTTPANAGLRADDYSNDIVPKITFSTDSLSVGDTLVFIKGILTRSFGNWKILPRNKDDIYGFATFNSVKEINDLNRLVLYPNPASNEIIIEFNNNSGKDITLQLNDLSGRNISTNTYSLNSGRQSLVLPIQRLNNGIYFIQLRTNDGVSILKFVKN